MNKNSNETQLDELFRDQLSQASASVPPGAWESVSSAIGSASVATTVVQSAFWMKAAIGAAIVVSAGLTYYFAGSDEPAQLDVAEKQSTEQAIEQNTASSDDEQTTVSSSRPNTFPLTPGMKLVVPDPEVSDHTATDGHDQSVHFGQTNSHDFTPIDLIPEPESPPVIAENDDVQEFMANLKDYKPAYEDSTFINVPDAVTPNGDGYNDTYLIQLVGEEFVLITIYNAAGETIFSTNNKYQAWNCTLPNGDLAAAGNYVVRVDFKMRNYPEARPIIRRLTLIR